MALVLTLNAKPGAVQRFTILISPPPGAPKDVAKQMCKCLNPKPCMVFIVYLSVYLCFLCG